MISFRLRNVFFFFPKNFRNGLIEDCNSDSNDLTHLNDISSAKHPVY